MFLNEVTYFSIASIFAGLVFITVGIWAFCRKTPIHTDLLRTNVLRFCEWIVGSGGNSCGIFLFIHTNL